MTDNEISIFDIGEFSLGRKFGTLGKIYHSVLVRKLRHLGIERHFSILLLLNDAGSECSQKLIADAMYIDKATMVGVLDNLVESGLIKRTKNPKDRREHWIQLTDKGKKHVPEIKKAVRELNNIALKKISKSEINKIQEYLGIIYGNISVEMNKNQ